MVTNANIAQRSRVATRRWRIDEQPYAEYCQHEETVLTFGEYLVNRGVIDRTQLFRALQLQDRVPRMRVGESAAVLGYVHLLMIEVLYEQFVKSQGLHVPRRSMQRAIAKAGAKPARGWTLAYSPPDCAARARPGRARVATVQGAHVA